MPQNLGVHIAPQNSSSEKEVTGTQQHKTRAEKLGSSSKGEPPKVVAFADETAIGDEPQIDKPMDMALTITKNKF